MSNVLKHVRNAIRELESAGIDPEAAITRGIGPDNDLTSALRSLKNAERKIQWAA